ncbi:MAG: hypothetical protein M0T74_07760 [Desulfitobacterium hafniense]|nr:hypothetical protein [Desulfitobacterium hafniense]
MKKTSVYVLSSLVAVLCLSTSVFVYAGNSPVAVKKALVKQLEAEFDVEHEKLLKSDLPLTKEEILESAAAGDELKEKGIEAQKLKKEIEAAGGPAARSKEEILRDVELGISVIGESVEVLAKRDSRRSKVNSEKLMQLKQLKDDLMNDKISPQDAEKRIVDIKAK